MRGHSTLARPSAGRASSGAATPGMAPSALPALTAAPGSRGLIFTAPAALSAPICVCRGKDGSAGLAQAGSSVLARRQPPGRQPLSCCRASSAALPAPSPVCRSGSCGSQGWVSPGRWGAPRDLVCLAGGLPSALSLHLQSKTLEPAASKLPLLPHPQDHHGSREPGGGAVSAQCPAELPVPPSKHTHVPSRDVAHGGPGLSGYPCRVLGTQHSSSGT